MAKKKPSPTLAAWDVQNEADHVNGLLEGKKSAIGELKPVPTVHSPQGIRVSLKKRKKN